MSKQPLLSLDTIAVHLTADGVRFESVQSAEPGAEPFLESQWQDEVYPEIRFFGRVTVRSIGDGWARVSSEHEQVRSLSIELFSERTYNRCRAEVLAILQEHTRSGGWTWSLSPTGQVSLTSCAYYAPQASYVHQVFQQTVQSILAQCRATLLILEGYDLDLPARSGPR